MKKNLIFILFMAASLLCCTNSLQKENHMNDELLGLWSPFAGFAFKAYMKDGIEGPIFNQIGRYSRAATSFCRFSAQSPNYLERKVAASLAGYISNPDADLLTDLLNLETERDHSIPQDDSQRLDCQSVVEDIVFSAARWYKCNRNKDQALDVLRRVAQDSIDGQYWNTSSYAMIYLCLYAPEESEGLLKRFDRYSKGAPPKHPSRPHFRQEQDCAQKLLNGDKKILDAYSRFISNPQNENGRPELSLEERQIVNRLLSALESSNKR